MFRIVFAYVESFLRGVKARVRLKKKKSAIIQVVKTRNTGVFFTVRIIAYGGANSILLAGQRDHKRSRNQTPPWLSKKLHLTMFPRFSSWSFTRPDCSPFEYPNFTAYASAWNSFFLESMFISTPSKWSTGAHICTYDCDGVVRTGGGSAG